MAFDKCINLEALAEGPKGCKCPNARELMDMKHAILTLILDGKADTIKVGDVKFKIVREK